MTLDVPPQGKHPRGEGLQMDIPRYDSGNLTISGTEDEDPAEYFDSHEDTEELLDPLVDNTETEKATKAKLKELDRLAEFGVYEIVDMTTALGKKRVTGPRFVADETMYEVFAPSSTLEHGRDASSTICVS